MKTIFKEYFPHGPLPGKIIPYAHKGEWAVHEILPFLFQYIGPFHLSVASFNISEDSLRPMFFMKEKNELLSVRFLFDMNVHRHKIDMMFFSSSVADQIRLSSTHMKVLLVQNRLINFAMVGSANMNLVMRHEAGIMTTEDTTFNYYKQYYDKVFENDSIPFIFE
jgi:hypothetical protein